MLVSQVALGNTHYWNMRTSVEIAVAPSTAYPVEYAPVTVKTTKRIRHLREKKSMIARTFTRIPQQMSDPIPRMKRKRKSQDELSGVLDRIRQAMYEFNDMCAIECTRSYEIRQ